MNYKETLYFIAKCLTISLDDKNRQGIEKQLRSSSIDWDTVVKVSTAHFVFPALYCNLKRADFLQYLPHELVSYMEHITGINRERNKQIIAQAKELNNFLLANNITPLFLKGTGNLLAGVYDDIAERMVGDIDFIFSKQDYPRAIAVLREFGYSEVKKTKYYPPDIGRHYRRLYKENSIAAIEIHKELLIEKYANEFNYSFVEKDSQVINEDAVLSYSNKLNLSILANQVNDHGFDYKTMALRNANDVFLLSKKTNAKEAVNTLDKLTNPLNCFLAACYEVFNALDSLKYNNTKMTASYLIKFEGYFQSYEKNNIQYKITKFYILIKLGLRLLYKSIFYKYYRFYILNCITDKNWYKEKLNQLGMK